LAGNILDVYLLDALRNTDCKWKDMESSKVVSEFKSQGYSLEYYPFNLTEMRCLLCGLVEPVKRKDSKKKYTVKWKE
jgi:hypothetical protein